MEIKKLFSLVLVCLPLLFISSCVPETHPPFGVWQSENPNITLYVKLDHRLPRGGQRYPGRYVVDDEEIKIFAAFGNGPRFEIFEMDALQNGVLHGDRWLYIGAFRVRNDELHYTLTQAAQERTGYDVIVFHRLEHYDPINPEDWFPSN